MVTRFRLGLDLRHLSKSESAEERILIFSKNPNKLFDQFLENLISLMTVRTASDSSRKKLIS